MGGDGAPGKAVRWRVRVPLHRRRSSACDWPISTMKHESKIFCQLSTNSLRCRNWWKAGERRIQGRAQQGVSNVASRLPTDCHRTLGVVVLWVSLLATKPGHTMKNGVWSLRRSLEAREAPTVVCTMGTKQQTNNRIRSKLWHAHCTILDISTLTGFQSRTTVGRLDRLLGI